MINNDSPHVAPTAVMPLEEQAPQAPKTQGKATLSLIGGIFAGITASACCAGPLVLLVLGVSGSWISNLALLDPLRPVFMILAVGFLGIAYRRIYVAPKACALDAPCAGADVSRRQKRLFWLVTVLVLAAVTFPWYGPLVLDS